MPDGSAGVAPTELLMGMKIRTKLPTINAQLRKDDCDSEVQARDEESKRLEVLGHFRVL